MNVNTDMRSAQTVADAFAKIKTTTKEKLDHSKMMLNQVDDEMRTHFHTEINNVRLFFQSCT